MADSEFEYIVTLVHGTWGSDSAFSRLDGPVARSLEDLPKRVHVDRFTWSGANSVRARLVAATQLRRRIVGHAASNPAAKQFLVCHSHGGNIAMYALKDPAVNDLVTGVACFSTPFICVSNRTPRDRDQFQLALAVMLGVPLLAIGIALVVVLLQFDAVRSALSGVAQLVGSSSSPPVIVILVGSGLAAASMALLGPAVLLKPLVDRWLRLADAHERKLRFPRLDPDRVFIVRTTADEASAAIAVPNFLGWLSSRLFSAIFRLVLKPFHWMLDVFEKIAHPFIFIAFSPVMLIVAATMFFGSMLVGLPLVLLATLTALSGLSYARTAVFHLVSVEATPPGTHTVLNLDMSSTTEGLVHSAAYSNERALVQMKRWMLRRGGL